MDSLDFPSRKIHLEEITPVSSESKLAQARELLLEYGRFVISQSGVAHFCYGSLEDEAARMPLSYREQSGACLMGSVEGQPAGFIAWQAIPGSVAWELKRLWVRPFARGLSLGRALTLAALDRARAAGRKAVYLDTSPACMAAAHRLYLDLGFQICAPYHDHPEEGLAHLVLDL